MLGYNFFNPFAPQRVAPISAPVRPTLLPMPRPNYTPPVGGISSQQSAINAGFADPTGMTFETPAVVPAPAIMVDPVVNRNVTSEQSAKDGGFTTMGEAEVDMDGSTTPKSQADVAGAIGAVADFAKGIRARANGCADGTGTPNELCARRKPLRKVRYARQGSPTPWPETQ